MLTQSKETRDAWRASQRTLDIKVTIDGKTYGATDINSLKYDSGAYNGDTFAIGSTYSNTVQIEFSHLIEGLKLGMEVHPSIGIKTSSGYVYEPLGVFIISSEIKMDRNNNLTTVSASDRFCGLEGTYVSKLTYPAKVLDVIAEICAQSGVKANTDDLARLPHQADLSAPITGQSYRKALGWIAQLYVGYALFDRQGLFTIRTISEPNYELDPSQYEQAGLTKNEAAYKINGIQCQVTLTTKTRDGESTEETKNYQAGDATGSQIKLENNIMTPQRLNDIWEQLKDITFYPFSLNWFGNPAVEAGDWLRLEDKQGNSFVVPNSSYTLDFNGGLSATSKADQTTSSDQMVPWQGSVAQTIKELQLRRVPDGTVVFPPSVTAPPTNAKFNDVWFRKNGNATELWVFEKQDDGSGKWVRKDLTEDEIKHQIEQAQAGLNQAKADIINNKQKADADIQNLNKSIEDNKKVADQDIQNLNKSIEANKKVADESLKKLNDSVTNLQGQYDNNVVPNLNKVMADASDALQKYITAQSSIADLTKRAQDQGKDIADVTNTIKGLNINYANLAGDVNTTKIDVKGLQTTLGTANGDINQLKIDAQHMQGLLAGKVDNSTYTNFVNLTNQALAAKLTASDLNGYAKTVDVEATANGLRVDMNSVTDRMNNLKVGGRNLIPNSGTDIVIESKTTDPYPAWDNKAVYWDLTPGETYTFSVSATNTNGVEQASVRIFKESLDGKFINKEAAHWYFNADGKRHNFTFTTPNDAIPYDIWLYAGPMGTLQGKDFTTTYHHPQLEVGTVATDYRPAPEDVANDITQLSARITANSQQFSSYYTKSETNTKTNIAKNDAVNAIKSDSNWTGLKNVLTNSGFLQTADGFLQKVQQTTVPMFNGGGVNLLLNTQNFDHNWAWDNIDHSYAKGVLTLSDTNNGNSRMYQGLADNPAGKTFSLSFNAKISADCDSENVSIKAGPYDAPKWITVTGKNSQSYKIEGWKWTGTSINFSLYVIGGKIDISNLKLEYGSVATPYSPNPADLATQSAFSELSQSLEGLRSTVGSNYGSLQSQISQSSSSIRTELTDKIKGIDNKTTSTADSLNSVIGRVGSLENLTNFQVINNAINANDYTNTGNYFIKSTANTNVPGINWCYLKVERVNDGRIVQTWQADSDPTLRYVRTKFGDLWTQWQRSASYSEYSELNRTVQSLQSTVSNNHGELKSQISQTATTIRGELTNKITGLQTQLTNTAEGLNAKIGAIQIGGRNYLRNSDKSITGPVQDLGIIPNEVLNELAGKTITISCDVEWSGYSHDNSKQNRLGFEASVTGSDGHSYWLGAWKSPTIPNGKERISTQYTLPAGVTFTVNNNGQNGYVSINGSGKVSHVKIEIGDRMTDWSPAPEDAEQAFAEVNATINGLKSTVSGNYGTLNSQISQTAKTIRQEVSDKTNGLQTQINQQANNFNVSLNKIQQTDGVNILRGTRDFSGDWDQLNNWYKDGSVDPNGNYAIKRKGAWNGAAQRRWLDVGTYTFSVYYCLEGSDNNTGAWIYVIPHDDNTLKITENSSNALEITKDKWIKKVYTFTVTTPGTSAVRVETNSNTATIHVGSYKLEKGYKETPWTTSPYDIYMNPNVVTKVLTSVQDLNNLTLEGNYVIKATNNTNSPIGNWLVVRVEGSGDRLHQTISADNDPNLSYTRTFNGSWSAWQRTVTGGNIMAQINMSAGTTLIQNDKIYMDASSTIFSGKAFIPDAAITNISADKITAGTLDAGRINVINLNANNITAGTLRGSNGEFYLDSGALHVWQGDHNAWIDKNGIHDSDNSGNNVWISNGSISAYGNSSGAYLFDGGLYLHKSQSLSDAVLNPNYGSITKSDNIVSFGTSGLDIDGKDGFLLRTHGWNDQTLAYLNGNEIIGAGIAGKSDGFMNIAAKKQLFLYAGEPVQNDKLKTIPKLVLDGTYQNGQTALKGTFSQYFFQGPSSGFSGGITLQDEFVNVGSLNGKNYFSISSDGAISITANGKSILSLNGLFPGVNGDFNVSGNFTVTGSKNAIVPTSRGMAAINAYETAEYYFGDIGETQTNSNGVVTVMIDPYFLETVNTLVPYQVFLTSYGDGNVWVSSRSANNFTVKSSKPNIHFVWEIKAKRKGYENDRMKIVKGVFNNEQY
ncbi:hypothetical protein [Limosilactobacillus reuteri]|uniref:hypothetical protein n=1 Tax=Limosilactobacillus reuteri TaxID=1598 RepID=UPI0015DDC9C1|nr:hypothetical protein [Limosilactobacillus reuteri]QLL76203.1 hypothetical protein GTO86_06430 [Limosilactobacillus reuteri]